MRKEEHIGFIIKYLNELVYSVQCYNRLNLTDINVYSEDFLKDLLNLIFGYNLINTNKLVSNFKAIDLSDKEKEIFIQITSECNSDKIKDTVKKFEESGINKEKLIIVFISMKYSPRKKSCKTLNFNDLIKEINSIDNINKIEEIYNYCKRENENNINSKLLNDLFRVCDEFIKNKNYIAVKRLLDSAENNLNNKTDRINFLKIKGELLFYSGDIEGSKNAYKRIFDENYYNNIDKDWKIAIKLLNIYLTNDLYEEFLELQNKLDKNSLLYTIFDLNYKINNNNFNIEYENDLIGNNEQK